ncbi:hypothetical protein CAUPRSCDRAFT_12180 [Caulochytrium protostelioides]|uniref:Uncharacterized protein n=1 Tax=Caulochytrium protostelioides TaxID=1555241 RepID=A0A4P9WVG5_9FUNG|nr:hypothetical protein CAUPRSCDRAFT_12180 [Caulochytrium protostelioides]
MSMRLGRALLQSSQQLVKSDLDDMALLSSEFRAAASDVVDERMRIVALLTCREMLANHPAFRNSAHPLFQDPNGESAGRLSRRSHRDTMGIELPIAAVFTSSMQVHHVSWDQITTWFSTAKTTSVTIGQGISQQPAARLSKRDGQIPGTPSPITTTLPVGYTLPKGVDIPKNGHVLLIDTVTDAKASLPLNKPEVLGKAIVEAGSKSGTMTRVLSVLLITVGLATAVAILVFVVWAIVKIIQEKFS